MEPAPISAEQVTVALRRCATLGGVTVRAVPAVIRWNNPAFEDLGCRDLLT